MQKHISKAIANMIDKRIRAFLQSPYRQKIRIEDTEGGVSFAGPENYITGGQGEGGIQVTKSDSKLIIDGSAISPDIDLPDFMDMLTEGNTQGLAVYDSPEKENMVALVGRKGEEVDWYSETAEENDFEKGELDGVRAT